MKFSFLGFNDQSQPLAEAILAHRDHQLVTVYAPDQSFPADKFPGVRQEPEWEAILHNSESELVVISPLDDMDAQEDRLRRVVQCELPTIAVQPFCSVLAAYQTTECFGSLANMKHRAGGGEKKIFDDKEYSR